VDPQKSTSVIPYYPHTKEEKVRSGTVVPVEIGAWPIGIKFEKGEKLLLRIQDFLDQCIEWPKHIKGGFENLNKGEHIVHYGGKYASHLVIPVVAVA
jgi:predicted acyl esterase